MTTDNHHRHSQLLIQAARLLLEYNESSGALVRAVTSTARTLTDEPCHVAVAYRHVVVTLGDDPPELRTIHELRLNAAVLSRIHDVLDQLRTGQVDVDGALLLFSQVERETPRHNRWLVALLLGLAGSSFARLLGADLPAVIVSGVATALGLLARQELGRRHAALLALPFTAAFIGAVLGSIAIRLGWTQTPELMLVVPALMLVPGPHILNGLFDLVDNYLSTSLARLGLAIGLLLASALGIVAGARLVLSSGDFPEQPPTSVELNLLLDMVLAGMAACGFAAYFNTPWRALGMAVLGGMAGHGLRFLGLQGGLPLEVATFFGGLLVGAMAGWMSRLSRAPVAVIAFAGAVTMIPGASFYRALGGMLRLARLTKEPDPLLAASTISDGCEALIVVSGLALGLILGIRTIQWLTAKLSRITGSGNVFPS